MRSTAMRWNFREYRFLLSTRVSSPGECAHRECANSRGHSSLIGKAINLIRERAETVKVRSSVEISPDPNDDAFCHCAEQGKADFVITLNSSDFPEERLQAKVVRPGLFLRYNQTHLT
jgi:predicted nucleic acid-binding protein